jgi:hypothetical protein
MEDKTTEQLMSEVFRDIWAVEHQLSDICCRAAALRILHLKGREIEEVCKELDAAHGMLSKLLQNHSAASCIISHNASEKKS